MLFGHFLDDAQVVGQRTVVPELTSVSLIAAYISKRLGLLDKGIPVHVDQIVVQEPMRQQDGEDDRDLEEATHCFQITYDFVTVDGNLRKQDSPAPVATRHNFVYER